MADRMDFRPRHRHRQVFYFIFGIFSCTIIYGLVYFHIQNKNSFPVANMQTMSLSSSATLTTTSGLALDQKNGSNNLGTSIYYEGQPYLVNTPGCRILNVKPFGKDMQLDWEKLELLKPTCTTPGFTVVKNKVIHYTEVATQRNITCCFKTISRQQQDVSNYSMDADNLITFSKRCTRIPPKGRKLKSEFVQVTCVHRNDSFSPQQNASSIIDYQVIVPPPETHSRSTKEKLKYWKTKFDTTAHRPPNVLILGFDTVSRLHMIRSLPRTRSFILKNDFVEIAGYTKIGHNTFPNVMGLLGNMDADNYPCRKINESKFDDCPLLWKNFSSNKYITGFTEDSPRIAIFNFNKLGFVEQPTDYYMRPLMVAAWLNASSTPGCLAGGTVTEFGINYVKKFVYQMAQSNVPYFLFSWLTELSHDNFNGVQAVDDLFLKTLTDLTQKPAYDPNNTVIIFMSDHGFRHGYSIRNTFMGFFEENLPFFFIRVPPWFKVKYPMWIKNLEQNRYKLTSPLDVHQTLVDILHLSSAETNPEVTRPDAETEFKNTYSLFENIPSTRTCENSRIPAKYCMCGITPPKDITGELAEQFARTIVSNLWAEVTTAQDKCVKFVLSEILLAVMIRVTDEIPTFHDNPAVLNLTEYLIIIKVEPGSALFETRIRQFENYTTILNSSRTNSYALDAPNCIIPDSIKPVCFCKSWFTSNEEIEKYKW